MPKFVLVSDLLIGNQIIINEKLNSPNIVFPSGQYIVFTYADVLDVKNIPGDRYVILELDILTYENSIHSTQRIRIKMHPNTYVLLIN